MYNTGMNNYEFGQIKRRALERCGKKPRKGGRPGRWPFTPEMDKELQLCYDGREETIDKLVEKFGYPRWAIKKRAQILGIARCKMPAWMAQEVAYLRNNIHLLSLTILARKIGRSETAVKLKANRLNINKSREGFTARGLGEVLGVDTHKITYWIEMGWLKSSRRQTRHLGNRDYYYLAPEDVREFILNHPWEINFRTVEQLTVIEILTGETINDTAGHPCSIDQRQAIGA